MLTAVISESGSLCIIRFVLVQTYTTSYIGSSTPVMTGQGLRHLHDPNVRTPIQVPEVTRHMEVYDTKIRAIQVLDGMAGWRDAIVYLDANHNVYTIIELEHNDPGAMASYNKLKASQYPPQYIGVSTPDGHSYHAIFIDNEVAEIARGTFGYLNYLKHGEVHYREDNSTRRNRVVAKNIRFLVNDEMMVSHDNILYHLTVNSTRDSYNLNAIAQLPNNPLIPSITRDVSRDSPDSFMLIYQQPLNAPRPDVVGKSERISNINQDFSLMGLLKASRYYLLLIDGQLLYRQTLNLVSNDQIAAYREDLGVIGYKYIYRTREGKLVIHKEARNFILDVKVIAISDERPLLQL